MQVTIKSFDVKMELKNNGVELAIHDNQGNLKGDLILTRSKIIWCKGKQTRRNGNSISLDRFIKMMEEK